MQPSGPLDFLWRALAIFLLTGALTGIAVSLLLVFRPHLMVRVNRAASRWISTRRVSRLLERSIGIEHWVYRHHRPLGMLATFGACYILGYFGLFFEKATALRHLAAHASPRLLDMLLDALVLVLLSGAAAALFAGLSLWLRPSRLRGIEEDANRWISLRRATRALDIPRDQTERFVERHARRLGWLLLLGSVYLLFAMLRLLI